MINLILNLKKMLNFYLNLVKFKMLIEARFKFYLFQDFKLLT